jgi:membrane-associated phospholipid phosphatase
MDTSNRLLWGFFLCVLVFAGAWYDTAHLHSFTAPLNHFIQQSMLASPDAVSPWARYYSETLTFIAILGKTSVFYPALALLLLILAIKREWKALFYGLAIAVVVVGLGLLMKDIVNSPRPVPYNAEQDSFPSGHVVRTTLWCGLYLFMDRLKYVTLSRFTRWGLIVIPVLVGFARIGLSRHWFSDVMAGYALVLGVFFLSLYFIRRSA